MFKQSAAVSCLHAHYSVRILVALMVVWWTEWTDQICRRSGLCFVPTTSESHYNLQEGVIILFSWPKL